MNNQLQENNSYRLQNLTKLSKAGLNYVLIRRPKISDPDGDIDILVNDIDKATQLLFKLNYKCFSRGEYNSKFLIFDFSANKWIHLDVQSRIKFKGFCTPSNFTDILLSTKQEENDVFFLDSTHEIIITILHAGINKPFIDSEYISRIQGTDIEGLFEYADVYHFLPIPFTALLKKVQESVAINQYDDLSRYLKNSFDKYNQSSKSFLIRLLGRLKSLVFFKAGVAILGPDGSGKSTLINSLSKLQWPSVRKQYMGPSSRNDMNKWLFFSLNYISNLRDKYSKRNLVGVIIRILWVVLCYLDFLERFYRHTWFYGSGGIVFFDRFSFDMYFRKPTILNDFIFIKLFPRPKHVILCVGDSKIIYERKREEASIEAVEKTIMNYRKKLNKYNIDVFEVDTTRLNQEEVLDSVIRHLIKNNWFN